MSVAKPIESPMDVRYRKPLSEDGHWVADLVKRCPPLDTNSTYCNLLQCTHFADTCVTAEANGELVGFISGYQLPAQPDTLFVWQVAVDAKARGMGLASQMLSQLLARANLSDVRFIETTITAGNQASWALFRRLAKQLEAPLTESVMFDRDTHFNGAHDSEMLVRVGPIPR